MATGMTTEEAQEAVDNGDTVTASELQEMHPDKTMNRILFDIKREEVELELQSKIEEKYEFNEPRAAAKQGRKTCHTGPKGVLTDYEEAKLKMRAFRLDEKIKKETKVYMSLDNNNDTAHKLTIIDMKNNKPTAKELRTEKKQLHDEYDSDDLLDDDDDIDEEALKQYKIQKMKILQENRPRFGNTMEVTAWTFEKEVDHAPKNVWVVIHVYQDYLERCARMNFAIGQIAKSYPHIKFMRARSDRLGLDNYPEIGLPTFIIFKNGQQLQNHIAVHELVGNPFDVKDVEAFLIKNKVIQPIVIIPDIGDNNDDNNNRKIMKKKKGNISFKNNSKM
eukprot:24158_1